MDPDDAVADPDRAREAYRRLIDTGDAGEAAEAVFLLGALERNLGRTAQARTAFEQAVATGHPDVAPKAWSNLAVLEAVNGNVEPARAAFGQVIASGHPQHAPQAMFNCALFERKQGNVRRARELYRQAIATGHPEHARKAMLNLGNLEAEQGRTAEARDLYQQAIASGDAETADRARQALETMTQAYFTSPPPYTGADPEIVGRRLGVDPDEIRDADWATGTRPGYGYGPVEIWAGPGRSSIVYLDLREPDDFHAYMYLKERFGLD
jgi:tetratricopeptide (TPR) repeat protein